MFLPQKYEESLNDEFFINTPGFIEIKMMTELLESTGVDHTIVQEIFKTGIQISLKERKMTSFPMSYFPIKKGFKVEAILLLYPREGMENEFINKKDYLERMALSGSRWVSESIENEWTKKENEIVRKELAGIFSLVQDPFCIVSEDGVIEELNDHLALLVQKRKSLLVGEKVSQLFVPSSWETIRHLRRKEEKYLQLRNDAPKELAATIQPIRLERKSGSYLILFKNETQKQNERKKRKLYTFEEIKGTSEVLQMAIKAAKRVSKNDATIMLRGESGTGKELFAQSIHNESERKNKPFVAINCAAIPENLLESELFGYEKGAFTGAASDKPGRFELANDGTLFLDEIGDMSLYLQAKLLRVVQEKSIERVGSNKSREIDVRIITATHQNLENLVKDGKFREDLYYRISVIPIFIPPLRERKEDLPLLIEHYMSKFSEEMKRSPKRLSDEVYHTLIQHDWPGNIRELQNVVRHFIELEIGDTVTLHSLPSSFSLKNKEITGREEHVSVKKPGKMNKEEIIHLLDRHGWSTEGKKKAALALGISLPTFYRWMKKLKF